MESVGSPDALGAGVTVVAMLFSLCVGMAIAAVIYAIVAFILIEAYKVLPVEHQLIEPKKIWFLVIPIFNVFWNFMVWPKVSESYQAYFAAQGQGDQGDCGRQMGLILSILFAVSFVTGFIPFVGLIGCITGPASLVLLILLLIKFHGYKKIIVGA